MAQDPSSQIQGSTQLVEVRDSVVAAALRAVDIPFFNPERPSTLLAFADGRRVPAWRFKGTSVDGKLSTAPLAKAAAEHPYDWIAANPDHPFAYALSAALRTAQFLEAEQTKRAMVGFRLADGKLMFVFEGSRKAEALKAKGAVQI